MIPTDNAALDQQILDREAREGERMLQAVYDFLGRFVSYPSEHAQVAHAIWCIHTHLMHLWDSTPRLAFLSPEPASGKSRALEVTELLVPNPVIAVNVSPACLFRKVGGEDGPPTILFDEIDTVFGPKAKENEEIRGLLNAGHRRDAVAGRCVIHGKTVQTEEIPAYSAVALAGLGWLPDTIMGRAVVIRMRPRHAGERIESFRRRIHKAEGDKIRQRIEAWARAQSDEIAFPEPPRPASKIETQMCGSRFLPSPASSAASGSSSPALPLLRSLRTARIVRLVLASACSWTSEPFSNGTQSLGTSQRRNCCTN